MIMTSPLSGHVSYWNKDDQERRGIFAIACNRSLVIILFLLLIIIWLTTPPKLLDRSSWNFLTRYIYHWARYSDLSNFDPDHGSWSRSLQRFSEKPLYLRDYLTDFQYLYIKWKLSLISTKFTTKAKGLKHSLIIRFWPTSFSQWFSLLILHSS